MAEATVSKPEAVRRAIEALGYQAEVSEILAYVREHFGISEDSAPMPAAEQRPSPSSLDSASRPATARKQRPRPAPGGETP
jgi:hypothetical protein